MSLVVFFGPKGPSAWRFQFAKGKRHATCLNDGFIASANTDSRTDIAAALQSVVTHTVQLSGTPTLVVPVDW